MGSSGGDAPPVDQTPQTIQSVTNWQAAPSIALAEWLTPLIGQGIQQYGGQLTADPNQLMLSAEQQLGQLQQQGLPLQQQTGSALTQLLSGGPSTTINPQTTAAFFNQSIRDPAIKQFQETTLPGIRSAYAGPGGGFWSSDRAGAEARAITDFGGQLSAQQGALQYADEQARRGLAESGAQRQLGAIPGALQFAQQPLQQALATGQFGGVLTQLADLAAQREYERFRAEDPANAPYAQYAMQLMGIPILSAYQNFAPPEAAGGGGFDIGGLFSGGIGSALGAAALTSNPWLIGGAGAAGALGGAF